LIDLGGSESDLFLGDFELARQGGSKDRRVIRVDADRDPGPKEGSEGV
jgi:hypothetical protein